jgi:predicted ABC-type ATPase
MRLLQTCQEAGYRVTLIFLWLPSPATALARVARRVREGGHNVPDDVVIRRYHAGLRNMRHLYLPIADIGLVYDNSDGPGVLVAESRRNGQLLIHDRTRWNEIEDATR